PTRVAAAPPAVPGREPDPRRPEPRPRAPVARRARQPLGPVAAEGRAAALPAAVAVVGRAFRARDPDRRRGARDAARAHRRGAHGRLVSERARDAPAAPPRPATGAVRRLFGGRHGPARRDRKSV